MNVQNLSLGGLLLIEADVFTDDRGYFIELFHEEKYFMLGVKEEFRQDNLSVSKKNVVRGLHFQVEPFEQGKLVRVIKGAALDVVVDIRPDSPTFGRHESVMLTGDNRKVLWIPPGFAHGFSVLEDETVFHYKCTNFYNKDSEKGIRFDDGELNIDWQVKNSLVSEKDMQLMTFGEYRKMMGLRVGA